MAQSLVSASDNVQVWAITFGAAAEVIKHSLNTTRLQVSCLPTGAAALATVPACAFTDANTLTVTGTEGDTARVYINVLP